MIQIYGNRVKINIWRLLHKKAKNFFVIFTLENFFLRFYIFLMFHFKVCPSPVALN